MSYLISRMSREEFIKTRGAECTQSIWYGEKLTKSRESHIKHKGVEKISPCKSCYLPRKTI
jgi:hypothetical protein